MCLLWHASWDKWCEPALVQLCAASRLLPGSRLGIFCALCGGVVKGPLLSLLLHGGVSRTSLYVDFGRKMGFVIKGMDQLLEKD